MSCTHVVCDGSEQNSQVTKKFSFLLISVKVFKIFVLAFCSTEKKKWLAVLSCLFCRLFALPRTMCHLHKSEVPYLCTGVNLVINTDHHHD